MNVIARELNEGISDLPDHVMKPRLFLPLLNAAARRIEYFSAATGKKKPLTTFVVRGCFIKQF
ncbi:hypothetical protein [Tardiphaga robiniae]|uniref:hypothetical protein n=1 Tax=Tardiphaga robiniae TaxID=943830 RepID=UPI00178CA742|nr:hypothetical protein [Tardiphaga robiniae]